MTDRIDPRGPQYGRNQSMWQKLKRRVWRETIPARCHHCGKPLDQKAPPGSEHSGVIDHLTPWRRDPSLMLTRSNLVLSCIACNNARRELKGGGDTTPKADGLIGRVWLDVMGYPASADWLGLGDRDPATLTTDEAKWLDNFRAWRHDAPILAARERTQERRAR